MKTKIALIQLQATPDKNINIQNGIEAIKVAADNGAEVVCFAELAFTRFYPQKPADKDHLLLAENVPGETTDIFCELAKKLGIVIIINLYERNGEEAYDSSPVIDSDGKILGITRMVHITEYEYFHEQGYYTPGNTGVQVYNTKFGKLGVAICYDRHYPEYMRALAIKGAEIVFIPQAGAAGEWPEGLYEAEMRTTAFQNGYFTALCNRVGKEELINFAGESFVCSPDGLVIARAAADRDEILYAELDLESIKNSYSKKFFLRDRRPELYDKWY